MGKMKIEMLLLGLVCFLIMAMLAWPVFLHRTSWDLHMHDTYFVITTLPLIIYALIYSIFLLVLYTIIRKNGGSINIYISFSHVLVTIAFIIFLLFGDTWMPDKQPRRYLNYSNWSTYNGYSVKIKWVAIITSLFVTTQVIFFVSFIRCLAGNRK